MRVKLSLPLDIQNRWIGVCVSNELGLDMIGVTKADIENRPEVASALRILDAELPDAQEDPRHSTQVFFPGDITTVSLSRITMRRIDNPRA